MIFRMAPTPAGGHVTVQFRSAPAPKQTFASLGVLRMSLEDWQAWRTCLLATAFACEQADGVIEVTTTPVAGVR